MDDLLREFLTETGENLDLVDAELVRFEQDPDNVKILENIFRLVHTIKGTCGFLSLPRLEALTHAAETSHVDLSGRQTRHGRCSLSRIDRHWIASKRCLTSSNASRRSQKATIGISLAAFK